jgi:hypothetical protein
MASERLSGHLWLKEHIHNSQIWENEAEILKEEFRLYARMAISALVDKEPELDEIPQGGMKSRW